MTIKRLITVASISIILSACGSDSNDPVDTGTTDAGTDNTADTSTTDAGGGTGTPDSGSTDSGGSNNGGSTDNPQVSGNITLYGTVSVDNSPDGVSVDAAFAEFPFAIDASLINAGLEVSQDECEVSQIDFSDLIDNIDPDSIDLDSINPDDFGFDVGDLPLPISAGEVITFTSPAGTYVELSRTTTSIPAIGNMPARDFILYNTETELSSPAPSSLVVDIPGAAFPAFSAQAVPVVAIPEISSPAPGESVTPTTQFTWVAGTTVNSVINIRASAFDAANSTSTTVTCAAIDDGSFTFDSTTRTAMGSSFNSGDPLGITTGVNFDRSATRFTQSGNAVLALTGNASN